MEANMMVDGPATSGVHYIRGTQWIKTSLNGGGKKLREIKISSAAAGGHMLDR